MFLKDGAVSTNCTGATSHVVHAIARVFFIQDSRRWKLTAKVKHDLGVYDTKPPSQAPSDTSIHSFGELKGNLTSFHMRVPRPIHVMWTRRPSC